MAICTRLAFLAVFFAQGIAFAHADYNNPTETLDCNINSDRYGFLSRRMALSERISQCLSQPNQARWVSIPQCGHPGSQRCAPLYSQRCQLENQMRALREMCMARLETHRAKEHAKKLAEEQAERERKQFLAEAAKRSVTPGRLDPGLEPTQEVLKGIAAGGLAAGRLSGVDLTNAGSLHLSAALTAAGIRVTQAIQTAALERFRESMAEMQRMNPSLEVGNFGAPSPGRKEAATQLIRELQAIERQISHAATMVEQGLPVGGASAVVGADAQRLTQIANAMADGVVRGPLFQTPASQAIETIERRLAIENDRAVRQSANREVLEGVPGNALRQRRISASREIENQLAQEKAVAAKKKEQELIQSMVNPNNPRTVVTGPPIAVRERQRPDCIDTTERSGIIVIDGRDIPMITIRNFCKFDIVVELFDSVICRGGNFYLKSTDNYNSDYDFNEFYQECVSRIYRRN